MPERDPKDLFGKVVAERYRIDAIIATGGMGAVYRGQHVHMHKKVAIKLLHPETKELPELVARFERESIVGANASHPNVASATDFGKDVDGTYYLVLEHIEGTTLRALLKDAPLDIHRAIRIARDIALGLEAIHQLGIVHRDLAPKNVLITESGAVKLIDFGLAKVPIEKFSGGQEAMALTTQGSVFGTIGFIAPEAAFGMHAVGEKADLYALGVILYEMVTGKHPFDHEDQKKLFQAHSFDEPPPPSRRAPKHVIPPAIERIVMRLLEKSPDKRYRDARDVIEQLDKASRKLDHDAVLAESDDEERERDEDPPEIETAPPARSSRGRAPAAPKSSAKKADRATASSRATKPERRGAGAYWLLLFVVVALGAGAYFVVPRWLVGPIGTPSPTPPTAPTPVTTSATEDPIPSASVAQPVVAPSASAAPERPKDVDGLDATRWVVVLREAALAYDAGRSAKAIQALAAIDPSQLTRPDVVIEAAAGVVAVALAGGTTADALFELLSSDKVDHAGTDLLYQVAFRHGGSTGAERATKLLEREDVRAHASPAMRIAFELRTTECRNRPALFDRAAKEGDARALAILVEMRDEFCVGCCLRAEPGLGPAIDALRARK